MHAKKGYYSKDKDCQAGNGSIERKDWDPYYEERERNNLNEINLKNLKYIGKEELKQPE
jgi:hypothetical protein